MIASRPLVWLLLLTSLGWLPLAAGTDGTNQQLRAIQQQQGLRPLARLPAPDPALLSLGQALFFDPILGGNKDVACATCHHPSQASADGRRLSVGTGGNGLGPTRRLGSGRQLTARHSPDLFERARPEWHTFFWDGRLHRDSNGHWQARALDGTPITLPLAGHYASSMSGAAVQSWLPPLARVEMRGQVHHGPAGWVNDRAWDGSENELAPLANYDLLAVWNGLRQRLLAVPQYRSVLDDDTLVDVMQRVGQALAAFMQEAFRADNTPWDRFLAGDDSALNPAQKRGALLFYGKAGCATCHTGPLFSDQQFHNIGVMPYAAALLPASEQDLGRFLLTGRLADRYAFRTPPLRNVALTAPYFHNGSVDSLTQAIVWHMAPVRQLATFDWRKLPWSLRSVAHPERIRAEKITASLSEALPRNAGLSPENISDLVAFLEALTAPQSRHLGRWVPSSVPSGLPVGGLVADPLASDPASGRITAWPGLWGLRDKE